MTLYVLQYLQRLLHVRTMRMERRKKKKNSRIIFSDDDDSILAVRGALKFFFFPSQLQINLVLENVVTNYAGV